MSLIGRFVILRSFRKCLSRPHFLTAQGHTMGGPHPGNYPPIRRGEGSDSLEEDLTEEQELKAAVGYEMIIPNYESENFTFDPEIGILQEPEDERKHFSEVVAPLNDINFRGFAEQLKLQQSRDFTVSSDPEEWKFVERLLPSKLVPPVKPSEAGEPNEFPSGFVLPTAKPGDYDYHVSRTRNHMLPVYTKINRPRMLVTTKVQKCDGDMFQLRDGILEHLRGKYYLCFHSQVNEVSRSITIRGDFEQDIKEFLLKKGF